MKQSQSWLDTISLLAGCQITRSERPNERLHLPEKWQADKQKSDDQFLLPTDRQVDRPSKR
jgi:hypothetical protein